MARERGGGEVYARGWGEQYCNFVRSEGDGVGGARGVVTGIPTSEWVRFEKYCNGKLYEGI